MKLRAIAAVAAIAVAMSVAAPSATFAQANGSIDIFYVDPLTGAVDPGACQGAAIYSPPFTALFFAEIHVRLSGSSAGGISGIECFVDGVAPTGWIFGLTPAEGISVNLGDLFVGQDTDSDGTLDTFRGSLGYSVTGPNAIDGCQDGSRIKDTVPGAVFMGRIQATQSPIVAPIPNDSWLRVVAGNPPSNPNFPCPLVTLCDSPVFTKVCVAGGSFLINPTEESCAVSVSEASWSGIKSLYR